MTTATTPDAYTGPPIASLLRDVNIHWPRRVLEAELLGGSPLRTNPTNGATSVEFSCADCGDTVRLVALWQLAEPGAVDRLRTAVVDHRARAGHEGAFISPAVDLTRAGGAD